MAPPNGTTDVDICAVGFAEVDPNLPLERHRVRTTNRMRVQQPIVERLEEYVATTVESGDSQKVYVGSYPPENPMGRLFDHLQGLTGVQFSLEAPDEGTATAFLADLTDLTERLDDGRLLVTVESDTGALAYASDRFEYACDLGGIFDVRDRSGTRTLADVESLTESASLAAAERAEAGLETPAALSAFVGRVAESTELSLTLETTVRADAVAAELERVGDGEANVVFSFDVGGLCSFLDGAALVDLRRDLFDGADEAVLCALGPDDVVASETVGVTGLAGFGTCVEALSGSGSADPDGSRGWRAVSRAVTERTFVDPRDRYLAPDPFALAPVDGATPGDLAPVVERLRAVGTVVAVVALADDGQWVADRECWECSFRGKGTTTVRLGVEDGVVQADDDTGGLADWDADGFDPAFSLYRWAYHDAEQTPDKLAVVREVVPFNATSGVELLESLRTVERVAENSYRNFVRERVAEHQTAQRQFLRNDVETEREFADLRARLMDDLSRDLFRTVGYVLLLVVGLVTAFGNTVSGGIITVVSGVGIVLYGTVMRQRLLTAEAQNERIRRTAERAEQFYNRFLNEASRGALVADRSAERRVPGDVQILPGRVQGGVRRRPPAGRTRGPAGHGSGPR